MVETALEQARELPGRGVDSQLVDSFRGSLRFLRRQGIGTAIYRLVADLLDEGRARQAKAIYGVRSRAVHGDMEAVREAEDLLGDLRTLVHDLLTAMIQRG
jgi:tRNA(Arg) A34 adenosine deaminase TadA